MPGVGPRPSPPAVAGRSDTKRNPPDSTSHVSPSRIFAVVTPVPTPSSGCFSSAPTTFSNAALILLMRAIFTPENGDAARGTKSPGAAPNKLTESRKQKSELLADELERRARRVTIDHHTDDGGLRQRDLAALVRAGLVGAAVVRRQRRLAADLDVEVRVTRTGHVELVG